MNTRSDRDLRDVKQLRCRPASSGIDQVPDIGISCRNHPIERCIDLLERLQFLEPFHIRLCRGDHGFLGREIPDGIVDVLLGNGFRFGQVLIARRRDFGRRALAWAVFRSARAWSSCWSTSGVSISASSWPCFHVRSDIRIPLFQISIRPRIDRRVDKSLDVSRQDDFASAARLAWDEWPRPWEWPNRTFRSCRAALAFSRGTIPAITTPATTSSTTIATQTPRLDRGLARCWRHLSLLNSP